MITGLSFFFVDFCETDTKFDKKKKKIALMTNKWLKTTKTYTESWIFIVYSGLSY